MAVNIVQKVMRKAWPLFLAALLLLLAVAFPVASAPSSWSQTTMEQERVDHSATVLSGPDCNSSSAPDFCGKVLVAGGYSGREVSGTLLDSAELYDPENGIWSTCPEGSGKTPSSECPGSMRHGRFAHSATQLLGTPAQCGSNCGKVLVAGQTFGPGGLPDNRTAELYDPRTGVWQEVSRIPNSITSPLNTHHSATLLRTGEVLFVGRDDTFSGYPGIIFDPTPADPDQPWSETAGPTVVPRHSHSAIRLDGPNCGANCGKVLFAGGGADSEFAFGTSAELYDPSTGTFAPTGALLQASHGPLIALDDGRILMAGADQGPQSQVYDPATGIWRPTGGMSHNRGGDFLTKLSGNRILAAGGTDTTRNHEIYYPDEVGADGFRGAWRPVAESLNQSHGFAQAVELGCGAGRASALVIGGSNEQGALAAAEAYERRVRVTGLTPASGRAAGGSAVTIRGAGFTPAFAGGTKVAFGDGEAANVVVKSDTELTATAPASTGPGRVKVSVSVDGGPAECSPELGFDYLAVPRLSGLDPPVGPATGGTRVTLTGSGFTRGSSVRFGDREATSVDVSADGTRMIAETPSSNPGSVPVVVSTPAGDAVESTFRYLPAITGVVPATGPPEGGTTVSVTGKGFAGARMVSFDGVEVAPTAVADEILTVKSPPHPPGQVRVSVDVPPHGPAIPVTAGADTFTYGAAALPPAGGAGQNSIANPRVGPASQTPTGSGGGPAASSGNGPPMAGSGASVPLLGESPVSAFEQAPSVMQAPGPSVQSSPAQVPGAAPSQASAPLPALVNVPEPVRGSAEQYAMVARPAEGVLPGHLGLAAAAAGLLLCTGAFLAGRERAGPRFRAQEAF